MLVELVEEATQKLTPSDVETVRGALARFGVFREVKALKRDLAYLKESNSYAYRYVCHDLQNKLRIDQTFQNLWKSLYYQISTGCPWELAADKYSVADRDIRWLWQQMTDADLERILDHLPNVFLEPLPRREFDEILKVLQTHARRTAMYRCRFIAKFDSAIDVEDLEAELVMHGINVIRQYDHFAVQGKRDKAKIVNYAKASITSKAVNIVLHYTCKVRSRVMSSDTRDREYISRIVSIDSGSGPTSAFAFRRGNAAQRSADLRCEWGRTIDATEGSSSLGNVFAANMSLEEDKFMVLPSQHVRTEKNEVLQRLKDILSPKERKMLQLLVAPDQGFIQWCQCSHGKDPFDLAQRPLRAAAARYVGLPANAFYRIRETCLQLVEA